MWPFTRRKKKEDLKRKQKAKPKRYESRNSNDVNLQYLTQWDQEEVGGSTSTYKPNSIASQRSKALSYERGGDSSDSYSSGSSSSGCGGGGDSGGGGGGCD